jgi:lysophospholipase L1-like esterase
MSRPILLLALALVASPTTMLAQTPAPAPVQTGLTAQPCPPRPAPPASNARLDRLLDPATAIAPPPPTPPAPADPAQAARLKAEADRAARDWGNLCRYQDDNAAITGAPKVVFMGDSITQNWAYAEPGFFSANRYVGRGISGQTTPQALLRFRPDVIALKPQAVHILIGTNDVAGNTGPSRVEDVENNIMSMVELAQANHIKVVVGSIPPSIDFGWSRGMEPADKIRALNLWLQDYARRKGVIYADYYSALSTPAGGMKRELSADGVHPNRAGYAVMEPIARVAIDAALKP